MKKSQKNGIDTIIAEEVLNSYLKAIKISELAKSETRYMSPVLVKFKDVPGVKSKDAQIWLCDTPGFHDNNGPEIDVANGIGIFRGISGAKSVRPVFLISRSGIEQGNLRAVNDLVHTIIRMTTDSTSVVDKMQYLFTKYDEYSAGQINPRLKDFRKQQIENNVSKLPEEQKQQLKELLDDMIYKIEDKLLVVYPVNDPQPGRLLEYLFKQQAITNPAQAFQQFVMQSSMAVIKDQVTLHKDSIMISVLHHNWELAKFKLDQLVFLKELLQQTYVSTIYEHCLDCCVRNINDNSRKAIESFNLHFSNNSLIKADDVNAYLQEIQYTKESEIMKDNHLKDLEVLFSQHLLDNINSQVKQCLFKIQDKEPVDNLFKIVLCNIKCISDLVVSYKEDYEVICAKITYQNRKWQQQFNDDLEGYNFHACIEILNKSKKACHILKGHPIRAEELYESLKIGVLDSLQQLVQAQAQYFSNDEIKPSEFKKLKKCSEILAMSIGSVEYSFKAHEIHDQIVKIRQDFLLQVEQTYETNLQKLNNKFKDVKDESDKVKNDKVGSFSELETLFEQMHNLKSIEGMRETTYRSTLEELCGYIQSCRLDFEHNLKLMEKDESLLDFQKLKVCLIVFDNCKWLEKYKEGDDFFKVQKKTIEERLIEYATIQYQNVKSLSYSISMCKNLRKGNDIKSLMNKMEDLVEILPEVKHSIQETYKYINEQIEYAFKNIKATLDEERKLQESIIFDREFIEQALSYVQECIKLCIQQDKAQGMYRELEQYINTTSNDLVKTFQEKYQLIVDYGINNENKEDLKYNLCQQFQYLKDIMKVKKSMSKSQKSSKDDPIIQGLMRKFDEDYREIEISIQKSNTYGDFEKFHKQLLAVKVLSQLDDQNIGAGKFITIYHESRKYLISGDTSTIVKDTIKDIDTFQYSDVYLTLQNLEENKDKDSVHGKNLQILNRHLKIHLEDIISNAQTCAKQFHSLIRSDFTKLHDSITQIHQYLTKLGLAQKQLGEKIQQLEIEKHVTQIQKSLENSFSEYSHRIEGNFKSIKLLEGEEGMRNLQQLQISLGVFVTDVSRLACEELDKSKKVYLEQKKKKLKELAIIDYYKESPKEFLEKLQNGDTIRGEYVQDITDIEDNINFKLQEFIEKIQEEKNDYKCSEQKRVLEYALQFLSDKLANPIKLKLEMDENRKRYENETRVTNLQDALDDSDIDQIQEIIKDFKMNKLTKNEKKQVDLIKLFLKAKVEKFEQIIFTSKESIINQMEATLSLAELIEAFPKLSLVMQDLFVKIQKHWQTILESNISTLLEIFSVNAAQKHVHEQLTQSLMGSFDNDDNISCQSYSLKEPTEILAIESLASIQKCQQNIYFNKTLPFFETLAIKLEKSIKTNYEAIKNQFVQSLKVLDGVLLAFTMRLMKKWEPVVKIFIKYKDLFLMNQGPFQNITKIFGQGMDYEEMLKIIGTNVDALKNVFREKLINKETSNQEKQRVEYYTKLNEKLTFLKSINGLPLQNDPGQVLKECIGIITKQIQGMTDSAKEKIKLKMMGNEDYQQFNLQFKNILSIQQCIDIFTDTTKNELDKIKNLVLDKARQHVNIVSKVTEETPMYEEIKQSLKQIKDLSLNIPNLQQDIDQHIDIILNQFKGKVKAAGMAKLGILLQKEDTGRQILMDHAIFKGVSLSLTNEKIQRLKIDQILPKLKGDGFDIAILQKNYDEVMKVYDQTLREELNMPVDFSKLTHNITNMPFYKNKDGSVHFITKKVAEGEQYYNWEDYNLKPGTQLVAYLFAYWTLMNSTYYFEAKGIENQNSYLFRPHAAQVLSVLCILGLSGNICSLKKNLVEIKTGEGKSITLAISATFLALIGFDVYSACYSKYLSQRDNETFLQFFQAFQVDNYIKYGTFNSLAEDIINKDGNIRNMILDIVTNKNAPFSIQGNRRRQRILLIDEVDVFFSKEFFGKSYSAQASLKDPTINALIEYIWTLRNTEISLQNVKKSQHFLDCLQNPTFKGWEFLIDEAVNDMLNDLESFESHHYVVKEQKIGYQQQDNIVFNAVYGFKTVFAYFKELERGTVIQANLNHLMSVGINCGSFSYVEIFQNFNIIMGVTGTLGALSPMEQSVIKHDYHISSWAFAPSAYGQNNLHMVQEINVMNSDEYHNKIVKEITNRLVGKNEGVQRAVLVFFESKKHLDAFVTNNNLKARFPDLLEITESSNEIERKNAIQRASSSGSVTVLTRELGRGTDFISRDEKVNANGGVHVIQTFLSEEQSEEVQIKGRTARQGESGSYSMVLLESDLEKFGITPALIQANQADLLSLLNEKRNAFFKNQYQITIRMVQLAKDYHQQAMQIVDHIQKQNVNGLRSILQNLNKCSEYTSARVKTIVLMDATGSMGNLLTKAKYAVSTMFKRASEILKEKGIPENSYSIQFAAYRNYGSGSELILQHSPFENKPEKLEVFMNSISIQGGQGQEAVEIGLWHANQQHLKDPVSQIILIGDAPANSIQDVQQKRNQKSYLGFGSAQDWATTKFASPTFYQDEVKKLASQKIPVHAFYVNDWAMQCFDEIAKATGGNCQFLNVNDEKIGQKMLTDLVTGEILRMIGQKRGVGDQLVETYKTKFAFID